MVDLVTTNKTSFFRESHHFDRLRRQILPGLHEAGRRRARLWSAGCASGEEAWSLALTLADFQAGHQGFGGHVLATDLDRRSLARARTAVYARSELETHAGAGWRRHFLEGTGDLAGSVRAGPTLRRLVEFRRLNLVDPDTRLRPGLDVVFCRNVLIYFDRETRGRVIDRFADVLRPGGYLFLGHAETLSDPDDRFVALPDNTWRKRLEGEPVGPADEPAVVVGDRWPGTPGLRRAQVIVGDVFADARPAIVRTLLGSCVATCLWDPEAGVGGVNHFMLPGGREDGPSPRRFGERAMELLFERLQRLGARPERLRAKIFGGSQVLMSGHGDQGVAARNVRYALQHMAAHHIPVEADRTGGHLPLEVFFQTHDGRAWVRALRRPV